MDYRHIKLIVNNEIFKTRNIGSLLRQLEFAAIARPVHIQYSSPVSAAYASFFLLNQHLQQHKRRKFTSETRHLLPSGAWARCPGQRTKAEPDLQAHFGFQDTRTIRIHIHNRFFSKMYKSIFGHGPSLAFLLTELAWSRESMGQQDHYTLRGLNWWGGGGGEYVLSVSLNVLVGSTTSIYQLNTGCSKIALKGTLQVHRQFLLPHSYVFSFSFKALMLRKQILIFVNLILRHFPTSFLNIGVF